MRIKTTKYFDAHILAMLGVIILNVNSQYPILYSFIGGWFIGIALKLARQFGEEWKK